MFDYVTIPVRLASTRFPDKVVQDIHGKSVMEWIWEGCKHRFNPRDIYFNTPDIELVEFAESFGAQAVLTDKYNCVLQQCSEVAEKFKKERPDYRELAVVQGDEPMITGNIINNCLISYKYHYDKVAGACLYKTISLQEAEDINTVKCVIGKSEDKLDVFRYFSRSIVPGFTPEKYGKSVHTFNKQVCVFTFGVDDLIWFRNTPMDSVEASEGIDLVRFTQHGKEILAVESLEDTQAVDVPADLELVKELMKDVVE